MKKKSSGFTVLEVLVSMAIGSLILVLATTALLNAGKVFNTTSGRDQAMRSLNKARKSLELDLIQVSKVGFQIQPAPASLAGALSDGDAIDLVSAVNSTSGKIEVLQDGSGQPYFYKNVIYYPTIPTDHNTLFGQTCVGGDDGGYDYNCPHKVLMRAEEDQNVAFDLTDSSTQDLVMPVLAGYLTRPTGFPKALARRVVSTGLLSFRVQSLSGGSELRVDMQALGTPEARRKIAVGYVSARNSPYTVTQTFSVFPKNP